MQSGKLVPLSTSLLGRWGPNFHCCWSVAQSRPTPCNPMDCSMPGFPVHHQLLEFAQTHVYSMAPHSSTLAWKIPWMEEPGRLQPLGLLTVRHDWATSLSFFTFMHWRRKWQATPVILPGESQGRGSLVGSVSEVTQSQTRLKWLSSSSMSIQLVMPSNHLILCCPLLLLPSIFPSIRVFSNELALCIRWPKYWSFSFSISPSNEYSGLISFRIDWIDLLAVQGTLKRFFSSTTV